MTCRAPRPRWCLLLLAVLVAACGQEQRTYTVAVLSPGEGDLAPYGTRHKESVRAAFGLEKGEQTAGLRGHTLRFRFIGTGNPVGDLASCSRAAESARQEAAVAVLGPVSSSCAEEILYDGSRVPVIVSLATATDLGRESEWFFRTITHDRARLRTFLDSARRWDVGVDRSVSIYRSSTYAAGLHRHLSALTRIDSARSFRWEEVFREGPYDEPIPRTGFRDVVEARPGLETVFVLGSSLRMHTAVLRLDSLFESAGSHPNFVLVGSSRFPESFPVDTTWIIGEAEVGTSRHLLRTVTAADPPPHLYISTLDAGLALRHALDDALLDAGGDAPTPTELRASVREELERDNFPSAERGRRVEFDRGEAADPPATPIYRVVEQRRVEHVNALPPEPWVEVRLVEEPAGFLAGPVVVEVIPHGRELRGRRVELQVRGLGEEPVKVKDVELEEGGTRASFVPILLGGRWFPGTFRVTTDETPGEQARVEELGWPLPYFLALLAAVLGAALYLYGRKPDAAEEEEKDGREAGRDGTGPAPGWRPGWVAARCLAGLLVAFLIIHLGPIVETMGPPLSKLPVPRFGSSSWVNGIVSGLVGGWLGLDPILAVAGGAVGGIASILQSEA